VEFVRGATAIDALRPGDRALVREAYSHHPIGDDVGRGKLPRWLIQWEVGSTSTASRAIISWTTSARTAW
jgi:Hydrogen maturase F tetramerization domain